MPTVLLVHHTPSPPLQQLLEATRDGAGTDQLDGVEVVVSPALSTTASDVLAADGLVLGTPVNLGYLSGALKHFFDTVYYPCLEATRGRPFGAYLHGGDDTSGAQRALTAITTGLGWEPVGPPVISTGPVARADTDACWELGATVAAHAAGAI